jgi:DNA-binding response OmpR family regulator
MVRSASREGSDHGPYRKSRLGCAERVRLTMAECKVLLVMGDRQVREVLHQTFLGAGYNCQVASDGHEGLEVFKAGRAPLVLTELNMPGMTGIEFLGQVRSVDAEVAVIVLAGASDVETPIECLKLGADAYIMKPINVGELLRAAERALEAHRTPEQFLEAFEHFSREPDSCSDPQFSDGIPIIRAWMNLRSRRTVSQTDLDGLLDRFAAAAVAGVEGSQLYDLWLHVVHWGAKLGLSVPRRNPWARGDLSWDV